MMNRSDDIAQLAQALAKAQGEIKPASIDGAATIQTKRGGSYGYTYATLGSLREAIRKPLSDNNLAIVQSPDQQETQIMVGGNEGEEYLRGMVRVETLLIHESGEWISNEVSVPYDTSGNKRPAQALGSAITYARRYGLGALLGLVSHEDDDAQATGPAGGHGAGKPQDYEPRGNSAQEFSAAATTVSPKNAGEPATDKQVKCINAVANKVAGTTDGVKKHYGVESLKELNRTQASEAIDTLKKLEAQPQTEWPVNQVNPEHMMTDPETVAAIRNDDGSDDDDIPF